MTTALAHRDEKVDAVPARELRARALSMLVRDYEEVRRMVIYLRHSQRDAAEIVPSLWAVRGCDRHGDREEQADDELGASQPANGQPAPSGPTHGEPASGEPAPASTMPIHS